MIASKQHFKSKIMIKSKDPKVTVNNRFQIYLNEYYMIKEKFDKMIDSEFLIQLKKDIREKEEKIEHIEKELKKLKKSQANQGKNLGKI